MKPEMLARIRAAAARRADPGLAAAPPRPAVTEPRALLQQRCNGNGIEWQAFADTAQARTWLAGFAAGFADASVSAWVPDDLAPALPAAAPESAALGVSRARLAVAESGTLVLDAREGRRTQLLPPVHLIWLAENDIVPALPDALARLADDLPSAVGLHSGPSRSADIGGVLVQGVHGPGRVVVALLPSISPIPALG
ncbi:hypothetical protein BJI67_01685 [Acidihalobacter aeolianus]|uniref:LUD domain-containing protein n=2 Tax=Acidihalobacter aeolianus TaxID=2792603 RepID=A0A1D8K4S3_9GAMM|nr:hypothetical protein BJI67_01685 [Acidihalobacter aeolianus]